MNMPTPEHQSYVPVSAGAQLRAYRENAQLTVDDVAHQLKLARRQVLAIENDELDALPGPTFVRGFIRNYARLLRIDPTPLLEASNLIAPAAASIEHIAPTMAELPAASANTGSWSRWLIPTGLVLALAAGIAFYEFGDVPNGMRKARKDATDTVVAPPAAPGASAVSASQGNDASAATTPPPASTPSAASTPGTSVVAPVVAGSGITQAPTAPTALADARPAPQPDVPAAGNGRIDFALSGTSWIEVKDGRGEVLLSKTLPGASQQSITGPLPLSVKVGNARAVQMQFNGSPIELAPYTQREIARLTLPLTRR